MMIGPRVVTCGDASPFYRSADDPDCAFDRADSADVEAALTAWRGALAVEHDRDDESLTLRWILILMVEENACHNAHADLRRERIDGTVGS